METKWWTKFSRKSEDTKWWASCCKMSSEEKSTKGIFDFDNGILENIGNNQ